MDYGRAVDHGWLLCFRGGSAIGLDSTIRLFNPYVSSIVGEKLYLPVLDRLSNVINDHRARLPMREKNNSDKRAPDNKEQQNGFEPSLAIRGEPAPIDIVAFGKRLAEIITKALRASRTRSKPRK